LLSEIFPAERAAPAFSARPLSIYEFQLFWLVMIGDPRGSSIGLAAPDRQSSFRHRGLSAQQFCFTTCGGLLEDAVNARRNSLAMRRKSKVELARAETPRHKS